MEDIEKRYSAAADKVEKRLGIADSGFDTNEKKAIDAAHKVVSGTLSEVAWKAVEKVAEPFQQKVFDASIKFGLSLLKDNDPSIVNPVQIAESNIIDSETDDGNLNKKNSK